MGEMIEGRNPGWEADFRKLKTGRNSYDAKPITEAAIERAKQFLAERPHVWPSPSGGIMIEWREVEIEIEPSGRLVLWACRNAR